jgi:hypothetical protein
LQTLAQENKPFLQNPASARGSVLLCRFHLHGEPVNSDRT